MPLPVITLPTETLNALGNLVVRFNHLEALLEQVLIQMLGMKSTSLRSHVPFANMNYAERLEVLETLLNVIALEHGSTEPHATFVAEIRPKLTDVNKRRNALLHARWTHKGGELKTTRLKAKGRLELETKTMTTKQIERLNQDISDAANTLWGLIAGDYPYKSLFTKG